MSKKFALLTASASYLVSAGIVFAQDSLVAPADGQVGTNVKVTDITSLIVGLLFGVAVFLALAYLMYGGIRWITSRGDKVGVESARKHIVAAIIGLVVVAGAFVIISIVFTVLGQGSNNPLENGFTLPTLPSGN